MAYLAPIHPPSSVRHALKLRFLQPDEECLVVAKSNRLELYALSPEGLVLKHSKAIYGKVTVLNKIRPNPSPTDHLFVGTDRFMYFTLSWDANKKQIRTESSWVDQAEKSARDAQLDYRSHTEPTGKFMTLEWYEGVITVLPIVHKTRKKGDPEIGSLMDPIPSRIPEFFVRSSAFIRTRIPMAAKDTPKLVLLYEDAHRKVRLKLRQLSYYSGSGSGDPGTVDFEDVPESFRGDVELGASHLIPISMPACGVLILGETSITYWEPTSRDLMTKPLDEATIFVTWEQIDLQRFVLADEYGKLYLLMLELDNDRISGWKLDLIGETSRASVLTYLDAGIVFVGSHQGDSQVIRITPQSLDVIQTFPNIAPILDFTIMDMGNRASEGQINEYSSGQARLVTGSGAFKDGSLRSVRSGVGMEELGLLGEMENVTDMFSLKLDPGSEFVNILVVSFIDETRVFHFDSDGNVEELGEFKGFSMNESTVLAANVGDKIVQVTGSTVKLFDVTDGITVAEWCAPESATIMAAITGKAEILLTIAGTILTILDIKGTELVLRISKSFPNSGQIACVTTPASDSSLCIVGFWESSAVSVYDKTTLELVYTDESDDLDVSVPRSMVVAKLMEYQPPLLFVAMADGNVVTYSLNTQSGALSGRKSTILGTQQANLRLLPREDGLDNVLAACEHPSLIYGSEGRMVFSAITAENASCVCSLNTESYPAAIAVATASDLKITLIDEERTTHVQKLHMGETVRRIAYSPELKAFGLGTIKRTLVNGVEIVQSHFKLAGEVLFNILHTYPLNENELVESVMSAKLRDGSGKLVDRFVVGTAYLDDEHGDSVRGRIIVFEVTEDRVLKVVVELSVKAACRCLAMVSGNIVAALMKTVVVYALEYETTSKPFLTKQASFRTSTAPLDVCVTDNSIVTMDLMKSVSILRYVKGQAGRSDTLEEVGRHFQTIWGTCVAIIEENTFLSSDAEGNLMVLRQAVEGLTMDDKRRLQVTSEMLLGEQVNRIRTINVRTPTGAAVVPKAFLATVEGSIHLFATISPPKQDLLMRLQSNMSSLVQSPGCVPFNKYRAFKSQVREENEPYRFVDGELIEQFLDCAPEVQSAIIEGLPADLEEVKGMVESLRRLR